MGGSRLRDGETAERRRPLFLYSRPACHLCEVVKPLVFEVARRHGVPVVERNVENDPEWETAFGSQIPVAVFRGRKLFKYRVSRDLLEQRLVAALARD